jgi:hypothetical protein
MVLNPAFIIAYATTVPHNPPERPLYHPSARQNNKSPHVISALNDLYRDDQSTLCPGDQLPGVTAVSPYHRNGRERLFQHAQQRFRAVTVSDAAVTQIARSHPSTSTAMWRLRPLIFFPASYPLVAEPTVSAHLTGCASITAAVGSGLRSWRTRSRRRNSSIISCGSNRAAHRSKNPYTVRHGG